MGAVYQERRPSHTAQKWAARAIRLLPDPVGVLTMTWLADIASRTASSWAGYKVMPRLSAQARNRSSGDIGGQLGGVAGTSWEIVGEASHPPCCPLPAGTATAVTAAAARRTAGRTAGAVSGRYLDQVSSGRSPPVRWGKWTMVPPSTTRVWPVM